MNGRQASAAAGTASLTRNIAGVVDGVMAVSVNPDSSMCLHVSLGIRPDIRIEIVLDAEQAQALFGASAQQPAAQASCQVGVQLGAPAV